MNKKILIGLIAAMAILPTLALAWWMIGDYGGTSSCYDSDGGIDFLTKGNATATIYNITYNASDYCLDSNSVIEYVCGSDVGYPTHTYMIGENCSNVNGSTGVCSDGACVQEQTCTDSDGGDNIYVEGNAVGSNGTTYDHCINSGWISEAYCIGSLNVAKSEYCGSGYICSDGACVQEQNQTTVDVYLKTDVSVDKLWLCVDNNSNGFNNQYELIGTIGAESSGEWWGVIGGNWVIDSYYIMSGNGTISYGNLQDQSNACTIDHEEFPYSKLVVTSNGTSDIYVYADMYYDS